MRIRVGHYMDELFAPGGIGSYIRRLATAQVQRGYEVYLFGKDAKDQEVSGTNLVRVIKTTDLADVVRRHQLDVLHMHTIVELGDLRGLPNLLRTHHGHHAYCVSGSQYLSRWREPCLRSFSPSACLKSHFLDRCGSIRPREIYGGFRRVYSERRSQSHVKMIAISEFAKLRMTGAGYPAAKIKVVLNPAPVFSTLETRAAPEEPTFIFLGRLVPGKGIRTIIHAAPMTSPEVRFKILGSGPEKKSLVQLAEQLGVAERFTWIDWVSSEEEVIKHIGAATAVLFPSIWQEPAGLVLLEAAAAGRPVIASKVGGIPEYAEKLQHAVLVAPGDPKMLASAIASLIDDAELARRLGQEGGNQIAGGTLSMESHLQELEEIYLVGINSGAQPKRAAASPL